MSRTNGPRSPPRARRVTDGRPDRRSASGRSALRAVGWGPVVCRVQTVRALVPGGSDEHPARYRTMKVLVSAASRHGATAEIARTIGETLTEAGLGVVVLPPDAVTVSYTHLTLPTIYSV